MGEKQQQLAALTYQYEVKRENNRKWLCLLRIGFHASIAMGVLLAVCFSLLTKMNLTVPVAICISVIPPFFGIGRIWLSHREKKISRECNDETNIIVLKSLSDTHKKTERRSR